MAREGKVIVKILRDVCSPIPYMGHSHERSLVHLLNPCDDVNKKDIQCNTFSFDYYEEGDNLVFKVKDNPTIVGYNVSKEFTVVYWDGNANSFVHTQGDGNGGNFNRSGFFQREGDYYVGKVNKDWFLRTFDLKEIAIRVAYFDLDNHEEELIFCYSDKKKSNQFTSKQKDPNPKPNPDKPEIKCSPTLEVTRQDLAFGYSYHLVFGINDTRTNFKVGEEVKYYIKYFIDDVEQPEELVYTHTTGGLVPNKEKDILIPAHVKKVRFIFMVVFPEGYTVTGADAKNCHSEVELMTPNSNTNPKPKPKIEPTCNGIEITTRKTNRDASYKSDITANITLNDYTGTFKLKIFKRISFDLDYTLLKEVDKANNSTITENDVYYFSLYGNYYLKAELWTSDNTSKLCESSEVLVNKEERPECILNRTLTLENGKRVYTENINGLLSNDTIIRKVVKSTRNDIHNTPIWEDTNIVIEDLGNNKFGFTDITTPVEEQTKIKVSIDVFRNSQNIVNCDTSYYVIYPKPSCVTTLKIELKDE